MKRRFVVRRQSFEYWEIHDSADKHPDATAACFITKRKEARIMAAALNKHYRGKK